MLIRVLLCSVVAFAGARADFQYQSTSHMTGGSLLQMMRFVPGNSAMKEPDVSTVAVHGNRMVRRGKRQAEIIDLDKRTITTVNFEKHTFSEMTFEQMKQMMEDASNKVSGQSNVNMDASLKDTGVRRTVNGMDAHQVIVTMTMNATDPKSGQSGAMKMNSETWISKDVPGAGEMREFYRRMAKELDWAPTGLDGMMNRPDLANAMAKMMAEGGKMEGIPVEQIVRIGVGLDGVTPDGQTGSAAPPPAPRPSASDVLSGALGAKLGGLGGFGRKKKQDAAAADSQTGDAPANGQASGALMEMTIDNTGFSTAAVDASLFAVPADFKKVAADQPGRHGR